MSGKFLFLGTGASTGIPFIGCDCAVCTSASPYNQRLRPSGLLTVGGKTILVDAGPDFRQQALKYKIGHLDGLILTHTHFDHIAGIDELRIYYVRQKKPLPCLLSNESFHELKIRYYYLFQPIGLKQTLSAQLDPHLLPEDAGEIEFLEEKIRYFSYFQGAMKVTGFRIGDFAYVSDIRLYKETIFGFLKGVRTLVLSALRERPSELHLCLDEAVAFARKAGAKITRLTHMNHEVEHAEISRKLPSDVQLAYDGLEIEFGT